MIYSPVQISMRRSENDHAFEILTHYYEKMSNIINIIEMFIYWNLKFIQHSTGILLGNQIDGLPGV